MKVLIVGYGSIAQKHVHALKKIIPDVKITALRSFPDSKTNTAIKSIYSWEDIEKDIDFVIISNPTSLHFSTIQEAIKLGVPLFIEKPPFGVLNGINELVEVISSKNIVTYTAFNLRFHPVISWLKKHLETRRIIEVQSYCGSYLPDWRPGTDYRINYSAKKSMGGGVHLDLIHELDYLHYLFGLPKSINSLCPLLAGV